jgi:hypothetical protein
VRLPSGGLLAAPTFHRPHQSIDREFPLEVSCCGEYLIRPTDRPREGGSVKIRQGHSIPSVSEAFSRRVRAALGSKEVEPNFSPSVTAYRSTQHSTPEYLNLQKHRFRKLNPYLLKVTVLSFPSPHSQSRALRRRSKATDTGSSIWFAPRCMSFVALRFAHPFCNLHLHRGVDGES